MEQQRSMCPISCALDLVGDKWTLLILRDLLLGKTRYSELSASPETIPSNLLATRLRKMEAEGLLSRVQYSHRPPRFEYRLTQKGKSLLPTMRELARWSARHIEAAAKPPPPF